MPAHSLKNQFSLSLLSLAIAKSVSADTVVFPNNVGNVTISSGTYYNESASDVSMLTLSSVMVTRGIKNYVFRTSGTLNIDGNLVVNKGLNTSGILYYDQYNPDIDLNIASGGSIQVLAGLGSPIRFGQSARASISNSGYLYSRDSEAISISPDNPNGTTVVGDFTNERHGTIKGYAALRIFEGDLDGSFINKGTIETSGSSGLSVQLGHLVGNIENHGSWSSKGSAIWINDASSFDGEIINTGSLSGTSGVIKISGDETAGDSFARFGGGIENKNWGSMETETGHAIEITNASFSGGIINEAGSRIITHDPDKAAIYIGANPADALGTAGLISDGVDNDGAIIGGYSIKNDNADHDLEVLNRPLGLLQGKISGRINLDNQGVFSSGRQSSITGDVTNTGVLELDIDEDSITSPALTVSGTTTLSPGSTVLVIPTTDIYFDDSKLNGEVYKVLSSGTLVDNGSTMESSLLLQVTKAIDGNTLTATVSRRQTDDILPKSIHFKNFIEATKNSTRLFDIIAPYDDVEQLNNLLQESAVNNSSQQVNSLVQQETMAIVLKRLDSQRDAYSSISYGDEDTERGFWVKVMSSDASQDNTRNSDNIELKGFDAEVTGISLGADKQFQFNSIGLTVGSAFTRAMVDVFKHRSSDRSNVENYQLGLYSSLNWQNWFVDGVLNVGWGHHDRTRYIDGIINTPILADFKSKHLGLKLLVGYNALYKNITIEPLLGFSFSRFSNEGYREKDSYDTGFAQSVRGDVVRKVELGAGIAVSRTFLLDKGTLEPSLSVMAWHDLKRDTPENVSRYLVGGNYFAVQGVTPKKDSYTATFNLKYHHADNMSFATGYERNQKSGYVSNNYFVEMRYAF